MNNHKMYVSIIIATNNSEKTIYDCLNSIKKQTYFNYEVIIIDNASLDSTIEIVRIVFGFSVDLLLLGDSHSRGSCLFVSAWEV